MTWSEKKISGQIYQLIWPDLTHSELYAKLYLSQLTCKYAFAALVADWVDFTHNWKFSPNKILKTGTSSI